MKSMLKIALVSSALVVAGSAQAGSNILDPGTFATVTSPGSAGYGTLEVTNGVVSSLTNPGGKISYTSSGTPDGYASGAGSIADVGSVSNASASLAEGAVHAYSSISDPGGSRAFFAANGSDTLFFNNTSGGVVNLTFQYSYDGQISPTGGLSSQVYSSLFLKGDAGCDALFVCGSTLNFTSGTNVGQTTSIGYSGLAGFNGIQQGGAFVYGAADSYDPLSYSVFKDWSDLTGYRNTIVTATIAVPVGISRLAYKLAIGGSCGVNGSVCDFGNTSKFGLGAIPTGLTVTSASGLFPTGIVGGGGVPEPSTWALMLAGFGLMGAGIRRRRRVALSVG